MTQPVRVGVNNIYTRPLVSIITPSYNHEKFLPDYFKSIINQTYRPLEVVFKNDASTDNTKVVAQEYLNKLVEAKVKVTMMHNSINEGGHTTMASVGKRATGKYVALLDGDDYYYPTKIEESIDFLERFGYDAVHTEFDKLVNGQIQSRCWEAQGRKINSPTSFLDILNTANTIMTCTFVVKREVWNIHPGPAEWLKRGYLLGDFPSFLWIARRYNIGYLDKALSVYRVQDKGLMHTGGQALYESGIQIMNDARAGKL